MNDDLCQCGCGQPAPIAKRTVATRGRFKGQPMRFIRGHNSFGMDRSGPRKLDRYDIENRGYKTPCWVWKLKKVKAGYGWVGVKGRQQLAHRWYYEQIHGTIPKGMQIDHLCRVRACVNPDHLEAVTPLENTRRSRSMKLTMEESREIERLTKTTNLDNYEIAERFTISDATVGFIRKNGAEGPRNPTQNRKPRKKT